MQITTTDGGPTRANSHTNRVSAQMRRRRPTMNRPRARDQRARDNEQMRSEVDGALLDLASDRLLGLADDTP